MSSRVPMSQLHFDFLAPKSRLSFVANIRYIVYDCSSSIGQRCAGSIFAISKLHTLSQLGISRIYRRYILPPISHFVFIVDFTPQSCWHTLFATAEFIFDDWHRFLGNISELPCWSAHCSLSAYSLSVVIPPMIALHRFQIPRTFLPLFAHSYTWIVAIGFAFLLLLFVLDATHLNISATLTFVPNLTNCSRLWRYNKFTERS